MLSVLFYIYIPKVDLKKKIIRTVNNPIQRFDEDALRILRALRFACQLKFSIELETKKAIHSEKKLLKNIYIIFQMRLIKIIPD